MLSLQLVPLITQGQQNHLELMGIMKGVLHNLNSLTEKIGSSFVQPPPPVVVLESSKPQNSDAQRADRCGAPPWRDIEFNQPSKGKEIAESPEVVGIRPNLYVPRMINTLPSSVQSAQTPPGLGHYWFPCGTYKNFRQTYNPLFEGHTAEGQGREQAPFWPHQQNV